MNTIKYLLENAIEKLNKNGVESPSIVAELLLGHVLKMGRDDLRRNSSIIPGETELTRFKELLERALRHEPVQYILKETEFMGLQFYVDNRVLIPRPDTEILVEKVIELSRTMKEDLKILDIGTGSGNIAVALAKFIPHARIDAVDISNAALDVAGINVQKHTLNERVHAFRWDCNGETAGLNAPYDVVISNPPYISAEEYNVLPKNVKDYEPRSALFDGGDGLSFYRKIASIVPLILQKGGLVAVEIGYNQSESVKDIFNSKGYTSVNLFRDYNGIERVLTATIQ